MEEQMISLVLVLMIGQQQEEPPILSTHPPLLAMPSFKKEPTFWDALKQAKTTNNPLVVFAGIPAQKVPGVVVFAGGADLDPKGRPSVLIYLPVNGEVQGGRRYDPGINVLETLGRQMAQEYQPLAVPFVRPDLRGDGKAAGPWPGMFPFPKRLNRFKPTQVTQEIFVLGNNGIDRDVINAVPRSRLEAKWQVPGGMEGIKGWKSDLYRYVPYEPDHWIGDISVLNSFNNFQKNRGHLRSYPDGTEFHDVLSKDDVVFEHRIRDKAGNIARATQIEEDA
jgi:hypothetical protein